MRAVDSSLKICMVVPYDLAEEGGVKRHATQLASVLRSRGDEVDVVGPLSRPHPVAPAPHVYGFRGVVNVPANGSDNRLGIFACPWKVARWFRERRYDVVHVHEPLQPSLNYYALWSAGNAARIGTFHGYMEAESTALLRARRFWSAVAFPWYDRGIAVSPAAHDYARVTFKKPLAIIPNGIRTELYTAGRVPQADAPLRMLFVGHWRDSRKGLPHLLDACARLGQRGVAWTLDIVGDGGAQPKSELPGITYHGPISSETRVAELYAGCDVFVSPAVGGESFGIVLLEAMASARPIVCSDIAGYRYAVGVGPSCGAKLVAPGDVDGLIAALAELAADPALRTRLGAHNRDYVRRFDWQRLADRVREQYLAALASRGAAVASRHAPVAAADAAV
jgi:phosphatidylinositol alpha-mannosyltransferase